MLSLQMVKTTPEYDQNKNEKQIFIRLRSKELFAGEAKQTIFQFIPIP
jgi:hypothetical protein